MDWPGISKPLQDSLLTSGQRGWDSGRQELERGSKEPSLLR